MTFKFWPVLRLCLFLSFFFTIKIFAFELFVTPDKSQDPIERTVSLIDAASSDIKIAMYRISSPRIIQSLERAVKRGVKVSAMLNSQEASSLYEYKTIEKSFKKLQDTNAKSAVELQNIGVTVTYPRNQYYLYHVKFVLIDNKLLWFGTLNFTDNGFENDRNFFLTTQDQSIIKDFSCIWKIDREKSQCSVSSQVILGPVGQRKKISELLYSAQSSVRIYMPSIEDLGIGTALIQIAEKGVKVEIVATAGHTENRFSAAIHKLLTSSSKNIDIAYQATPPVHAKAILVDYGTENARLYLGTCNMFYSSLDSSREVGIVIRDGTTIKKFYNIYQQDFLRSHE